MEGNSGILAQQMGITAQLFTARMAKLLSPHGLTYTQFATLNHLERRPEGQAVTELAGAMQIQQSGMSKLVARLLGVGDLQVEVGADARSRNVRITDQGRGRLQGVRAEIERPVADIFAPLSDEQRKGLAEILVVLNGHLDD